MDSLIVGLTGNICTGKSFVAKQFDKFDDVKIIDCDTVAKKLLQKDGFSSKVLNGILFSTDKTGEIIREYLKNNFYDRLWVNIKSQIDSDNDHGIFIVEGALIFEMKWDHKFDEVMITHCNTVTQFRRISKKFPNRVNEMYDRLSFQMPQVEKLLMSHEDTHICTDDEKDVILSVQESHDCWSIA